MEEQIIYKCHNCGKVLQPGQRYTLECACGFCHISFNKYGEILSFDCYVLADKREFLLRKHQGLKDTMLFCKGKCLFSMEIQLFFEDGIPQIEKMYRKIKNLVIFS